MSVCHHIHVHYVSLSLRYFPRAIYWAVNINVTSIHVKGYQYFVIVKQNLSLLRKLNITWPEMTDNEET